MNTEIIKVARKAAAHYKNSDGYAQAAEIITMLCDELEKTQRPVAPSTVKDVLLKKWEQDTEAMASLMLYHDPFTGQIGACGIDGMVFAWFEWLKDALSAQIAYLNSAEEVGR